MTAPSTQPTPERAPVAPRPWHQILHDVLKHNEVRLITYVPDNVLAPLIASLSADAYFTVLGATREEEALGMIAGAWMGGLRGALLMQTSGFATLANAIASLVVPYQIPAVMIVSERGTLGEFNIVQTLPGKTMRPVLDSLALEHHTITRLDEAELIADRSIRQAVMTQACTTLILSPLLTASRP